MNAPSQDDQPPSIISTFATAPFAVKALLFGVLVNKLGAFLQVYLVLFMTDRGFTAVEGGLALGMYGVGSVLGVLAGGSLSDLIGPRLTIVLGMAGTAFLLVAMLYVDVLPVLIAVVVLVGAVSQIYRPAAAVVLTDLTPPDRQVMMFAMYRLALNVGTTAAPLLGALLLLSSYDLLFWGEAIAALLYAAVALFTLPRRDPSTQRSGESDATDEAAHGGYRTLFSDRRYLAYLVAMLLNAAVYVQYLSTLPLAMREAGFATYWYSIVVALNGAVVICFELLVTKFVQNQDRRVILTVGFVLLGSGMALYAVPGGIAIVIVATLLWTLAEIIEGPTMFAYPSVAGPAFARGRYIGAAHAMFGVGSAIGPIVGVALWAGIGSDAWVVVGAVSVLAVIPARYALKPDVADPAGTATTLT